MLGSFDKGHAPLGSVTLASILAACPTAPFAVRCHGRVICIEQVPRRTMTPLSPVIAPLGVPVGIIVRDRSEKQTALDVATRRIVTVMQDVQTVRDRAVRQDPSEAVSLNYLALESDPSITLLVSGSGPLKAAVRHPDQTSRETLSRRRARGQFSPTPQTLVVGVAHPAPDRCAPITVIHTASREGLSGSLHWSLPFG